MPEVVYATPDENVLKKRDAAFAQYGRWCYYVDEVLANLGGAYREHKS